MDNMNEFLNKYKEANLSNDIDLDAPLTKWYGHPKDLPLSYREELIYRYQFLDESINTLAREYRVTPIALTEWLDENEVQTKVFETDEDLANFETHVNQTYKDLRVRMSGLVALQTVKAWHSLAISEDHILHTLEYATHHMHDQAKGGFIDVKALKSLTDAHAKVVDRQILIKQAIEVPADRDLKNVVDGFQKSLKDLFDEIDGSSYSLPSEDK